MVSQFLREELGRYFRETTIHGLSYIATQRNMLVKLFWVTSQYYYYYLDTIS